MHQPQSGTSALTASNALRVFRTEDPPTSSTNPLQADLIDEATRLCGDTGHLTEPFDLVIMNPPTAPDPLLGRSFHAAGQPGRAQSPFAVPMNDCL